MRTNRLFAGALGTFALALSLVSCSNEELEPGTQPGFGDGDYDTSYMSINISSVGNSGTRAAGDGYPEGAQYEDGSGNENSVKKVRVYFFDKDGLASPVRKVGDGYVSYFDFVTPSATNPKPEEKPIGPVEAIVQAQIVLQTPKDNVHPAVWCAAVINTTPASNAAGSNNLSLENLKAIYADYSQTGEGEFVMSSSVYADEAGQNGKEQLMVSVAGKIFQDEEKAKGTPVDIYVERTLARVDMGLGENLLQTKTISVTAEDGTETSKTITITSDPVATIDINGQATPVYVELLGWNITATRQQSYLLKHIDPTWKADLFGSGILWNAPNYFRSFWAKSAPASEETGNGYGFFDFNNAKALGFENTFHAYLQENTQQGTNSENPYRQFKDGKIETPASKVMLAAKLVDANGNELELADIAGVKYAGINSLKEAVAAYLKGKMYAISVTSGENPTTTISDPKVEDIDIQTVSGNKPENNTLVDTNKDTGNYYVTIVLSSIGEKKNWYSRANADEEYKIGTDVNKVAEVNKLIKNSLPQIQMWKNGYTYYYADIRHLGNIDADNAVGAYGVVRNHVYKFTIDAIKGLGTPVYDPKEIIYPEKPEKGNSYIAARIKVLAWRIVNNNTNLDWE